jgi:phage-related tail protein
MTKIEQMRETLDTFMSQFAIAVEDEIQVARDMKNAMLTALTRMSQATDNIFELSEMMEHYSDEFNTLAENTYTVGTIYADIIDAVDELDIPEGDPAIYIGACDLCGEHLYDKDSFVERDGQLLCLECASECETAETEETNEIYDGPKNAGAPSPVGND